MRLTTLTILLCVAYSYVSAQYYFTGEVHDLHGDKLQHVSITVQSTGAVFQTGPGGDFEIVSRQADDTLTFVHEGYDHYTTAIHSSDFLQVMLRLQNLPQGVRKEPLLSAVKGPSTVSFVGNSNGVSYNTIRRFLEMGYTVPPEAVKIEEMLGYFNSTYEAPPATDQFFCSSDVLSCPWNNAHRLLVVNISGRKVDMEHTPPANLVFLVDVSGSMDMPNKLPLIKASIRSLIRNLRDIDTVSIVQFGSGMQVMAGIPGSKKDAIIGAIEQLSPDGSSPGAPGLKLAYQVARHQWIPGGNNRIVFITDGDINDEKTAADDLADFVAEQSHDGIRLSCIGVGLTDTVNSQLVELTSRGQGSFDIIGNEEEGERALLREWTANAGCMADHVCVTADFDTSQVSGYRLLGFDNKPGADTNLRLEGRSVASAHSLMAVFEFAPRRDTTVALAHIRVDYCLPGQTAPRSVSYDCHSRFKSFDKASPCMRKATCVALFGLKLKGDAAESFSWADIQKMTKAVFNDNNYIDREYLSLVARARKIYDTKDDRSARHD